jgi:hypothetical protein
VQSPLILATFCGALIGAPVGAEGPSIALLGVILVDLAAGVGGADLLNHV